MRKHMAIRALVLAGAGMLALMSGACSDGPAVPSIPTGTARAETPRAGEVVPPSPSPTTGVVQPAPAPPSATPPPIASPRPGTPSPVPTAPPPSATAPPGATAPAGRVESRAPIERVEVLRGAGDSAVARITSGLPDGCARYSRAEVVRGSDVTLVTVYNHHPAGSVVCTAIYGMVTNDVSLGRGFPPGVTFAIEVNGVRSTFTLP